MLTLQENTSFLCLLTSGKVIPKKLTATAKTQLAELVDFNHFSLITQSGD